MWGPVQEQGCLPSPAASHASGGRGGSFWEEWWGYQQWQGGVKKAIADSQFVPLVPCALLFTQPSPWPYPCAPQVTMPQFVNLRLI